MVNSSDQFTLKAHSFTGEFAKWMKEWLKSTGADFKLSEALFFDVAMYRLKEEFLTVDKTSETKVNHFLEHLLTDIFEIQKKHVKIKIRGLPKNE